MAWNEPGGPQNNDPWGGRNKQQGPPDLDEIVRNMKEKYGGLFGGGGGGSGGTRGSAGGGLPKGAIIAIGVVLLGLWGASGFYKVDQAERGVVLRLGKFVDTTNPGLRWHLPWPIETVEKVNVERIDSVELGFRSNASQGASVTVPREALMLTQDENIVEVGVEVQYKVKDAKAFLFLVREPRITLGEVAEGAVREIVGKSTMDYILTAGRSDVVVQSRVLMQEVLDGYETGLEVTSVNLQKATAPPQVQAAFADAVKAREDEQRFINEAEAYYNGIIPEARGAAARIDNEARAYKARVVAQAEGEAARFDKVRVEYEKAPEVTRRRLYLETMEEVMAKTGKVVIDTKSSNNIMYLPLEQIMKSQGMAMSQAGGRQGRPSYTVQPQASQPTNQGVRSRDARSRRTR